VPAFAAAPRISDAWLEDKGGRGRRGLAGLFDEATEECPLALGRKVEEIVAFATLWTSRVKEDLSWT